MTVEWLRQFVETEETDAMLGTRLKALEQFIRGYTNNAFLQRGTQRVAEAANGRFVLEGSNPFEAGDSVQVSGSLLNDGLYTVKSAEDGAISVHEAARDEKDLLLTRVCYPEDVRMGAVEMVKYDLFSRDKANVQREAVARHQVTYQEYDEQSVAAGYPAHLLGFLRRHRKARFGQGGIG